MFSTDIAYAGVTIDAFNASGAGPNLQATGFRIIPVLAAGATKDDMRAAYSALQVRVSKSTKNFPLGITENMQVAGPDWVAAVGLGRLEILNGLNPTTYRVWIATDCKEMEFVDTPIMNGFDGAGASSGGGTAVSSTSTNQNLTGTAPSAAGDGFSIAGGKALRVSWKATNAGATLNAVGKARAYAYSSAANRWWRLPELDIDFAALAAAVVEPMGVGPAPWLLPSNIDRMDYQPSGMTVSAGTQVTRLQELIK